jgi:hypothetical protein
MQAALYEGMEGKAGLRGWQWLFVFNAIMTVVVALAGFFLVRSHAIARLLLGPVELMASTSALSDPRQAWKYSSQVAEHR